MRKRIVTLAALALLALGGSAPAADATVEWAHHIAVYPGESVFGNSVNTYGSEGQPYGSGIPCAGLSGWGSECAHAEGQNAVFLLSFYVGAPPYLHDHSTWKTYFNGLYF